MGFPFLHANGTLLPAGQGGFRPDPDLIDDGSVTVGRAGDNDPVRGAL